MAPGSQPSCKRTNNLLQIGHMANIGGIRLGRNPEPTRPPSGKRSRHLSLHRSYRISRRHFNRGWRNLQCSSL